jgi:tetratricopeptide (TPR) repeat protein
VRRATLGQEALEIVDTLQNPDTPRAWNYHGYATRKLGRTEEGVGYFLKSVALDPNYAQVREYLGRAYVIEGSLDLAKNQSHTIQRLCGSTECEEDEDLSQAINKAQDLQSAMSAARFGDWTVDVAALLKPDVFISSLIAIHPRLASREPPSRKARRATRRRSAQRP